MTDKTHRSPMDLSACRVLVTATTFGIEDPALRSRLEQLEQAVGGVRYNPERRPLAAPELAGWVKGIDGWIAGLDQIDAGVLAAADRLKVLARYGVGVDRVDLAAATERGVVATPHTGAHTDEAVNAMCRMALDACLAVLRGERPAHIVNPDVYQRPDRS